VQKSTNNRIPGSGDLCSGGTSFPSSLDGRPRSSSDLEREGSSAGAAENASDEVWTGSGEAVIGAAVGGGGGRDLSRWTPGWGAVF
jgi:hypothetical protein